MELSDHVLVEASDEDNNIKLSTPVKSSDKSSFYESWLYGRVFINGSRYSLIHKIICTRISI